MYGQRELDFVRDGRAGVIPRKKTGRPVGRPFLVLPSIAVASQQILALRAPRQLRRGRRQLLLLRGFDVGLGANSAAVAHYGVGVCKAVNNAVRVAAITAGVVIVVRRARGRRCRLATGIFSKRDVDAIGLYSDAGETCVRKLELREGRIVGSSTYFFPGDESEQADILSNFIMQYYEQAPFVPPLVLIPYAPEDADIPSIESFLSEKAGRKVRLHVAERGELTELSDLVKLNAREMMVRRILRGGNAGADPSAPLFNPLQVCYLKNSLSDEKGREEKAG